MNMVDATKMENYLRGVSRHTERIPFRLIVRELVNLKEKMDALIAEHK